MVMGTCSTCPGPRRTNFWGSRTYQPFGGAERKRSKVSTTFPVLAMAKVASALGARVMK